MCTGDSLALLNVCVHARTCSPLCRLEPDRGRAGYNGHIRTGEIVCVLVNHSQETHFDADGSTRRELYNATMTALANINA
jgi:hypothetical protein